MCAEYLGCVYYYILANCVGLIDTMTWISLDHVLGFDNVHLMLLHRLRHDLTFPTASEQMTRTIIFLSVLYFCKDGTVYIHPICLSLRPSSRMQSSKPFYVCERCCHWLDEVDNLLPNMYFILEVSRMYSCRIHEYFLLRYVQ